MYKEETWVQNKSKSFIEVFLENITNNNSVNNNEYKNVF
jgi:hypothetical protein